MAKRAFEEIDEDDDDGDTVLVDLTPYMEVKTWKHLCGVNIKFLRKEIDKTYYHLGPTDPETEPLLPALIRLNQRGIYTTNGQPGLDDKDDTRQRAFIDFAVKNHTIAARLLEYLKTQPFIYYIYETYAAKNKIETNMPEGTKKFEITDEYHEMEKEWRTYSARHLEWQGDNYMSDMKNVDKLLKKAGFFFVCHREFGVHESLEEMLLKFLDEPVVVDDK